MMVNHRSFEPVGDDQGYNLAMQTLNESNIKYGQNLLIYASILCPVFLLSWFLPTCFLIINTVSVIILWKKAAQVAYFTFCTVQLTRD